MRTLKDYAPRCEKACAVCVRKDWIENRARALLWDEATGTTSCSAVFYEVEAQAVERESGEVESATAAAAGARQLKGRLLTRESVDGKTCFCFGPKSQIDKMLHVNI